MVVTMKFVAFLLYFQFLLARHFVVNGQTNWDNAHKVCNSRNEQLLGQPLLDKSDRRMDALCDLVAEEVAWIDGIIYHLGCSKNIGECYYMEVSYTPQTTLLEFLCQDLGAIPFVWSGERPEKKFEYASTGCGPWRRLANLSDSSVQSLRKSINTNHFITEKPYWVTDVAFNTINRTCRALRRVHQSKFEVINRSCNMTTESLCFKESYAQYYQKSVKFFKSNVGDDITGLPISKICTNTVGDITTPRLTAFVDNVTTTTDTSTKNKSITTTNKPESERDNLLIYLSAGIPGSVFIFCLIMAVMYFCLRKTAEVTYAEPKDAIKNKTERYTYEHPYDKRSYSEGIITVKALKTDQSNYDYPVIVPGNVNTTSGKCRDLGNDENSNVYDIPEISSEISSLELKQFTTAVKDKHIKKELNKFSGNSETSRQKVTVSYQQVKVHETDQGYSYIDSLQISDPHYKTIPEESVYL